jgi:hypothetical protein
MFFMGILPPVRLKDCLESASMGTSRIRITYRAILSLNRLTIGFTSVLAELYNASRRSRLVPSRTRTIAPDLQNQTVHRCVDLPVMPSNCVSLTGPYTKAAIGTNYKSRRDRRDFRSLASFPFGCILSTRRQGNISASSGTLPIISDDAIIRFYGGFT